MRLRKPTEAVGSIADLNGNVLAARVAINIEKKDRGSFRLEPEDSFNFDMERPRIYRLMLSDGRSADIETMGFHLLDNSGTNFVSFRILNGLTYPIVITSAP